MTDLKEVIASIKWTLEVTPEINDFVQVTVTLAPEEFERMRALAASPAGAGSVGAETNMSGWPKLSLDECDHMMRIIGALDDLGEGYWEGAREASGTGEKNYEHRDMHANNILNHAANSFKDMLHNLGPIDYFPKRVPSDPMLLTAARDRIRSLEKRLAALSAPPAHAETAGEAEKLAQQFLDRAADISAGKSMECDADDTDRNLKDWDQLFLDLCAALTAPPAAAETVGVTRGPITDDGEAGASIARQVVQRICDFDDRTSPEDHPDMMLVTGQELTDLIEEEVSRYWPEPAIAADRHAAQAGAGDGRIAEELMSAVWGVAPTPTDAHLRRLHAAAEAVCLYFRDNSAAAVKTGNGDGVGPRTVNTSRKTCEGCPALKLEDWSFMGENDDLDSGTSARCSASEGKSISAYWSVLSSSPDWCPAAPIGTGNGEASV